MQLIMILLIIVSILTALSGIAVLSGAHKGERLSALIFFSTTVSALAWAVSCGVFLALPESTSPDFTKSVIYGIYISAPIMCLGLMSYSCYKYKLGKVLILLFAVACGTLIYYILNRTNLLYSGFALSESKGNVVNLEQDLFFVVYGMYHFLAVCIYMLFLWYTARHSKSSNIRRGNLLVLFGFAVTGILALIFNFVFTYYGKYNMIWVGPLAMSIAWIFHYYAILRYRLLSLSSSWLRGLSYIITMALAAIIYLVIFFLIFFALFKVANPSMPIIILNVLMIIAVLLMIPALNELSAFVQSLSSPRDVDVAYITKKLTNLVGYDINLAELASFLSDHLHFHYFGIIVDDELFGSEHLQLSEEDIAKISKTRKSVSGKIWLELDDATKAKLKKDGIEAVAELRDSKGEIVSHALIGKPTGRIDFADRDLVPVEIILNILPVVTHPGERRIKKHLL